MPGQLAAWGAGIAILVAVLGFVYSNGQAVSETNQKLDRNCRILIQLDQDIRLHILAERPPHGVGVLEGFPEVSC